MFSFFKKKTPSVEPVTVPALLPLQPEPQQTDLPSAQPLEAVVPERRSWLDKLRAGLRKTGSGIAQVFSGTQIDDALYDDLEAALLLADAGVRATTYLLADLKQRVKDGREIGRAHV